jgi:hypothetical protein
MKLRIRNFNVVKQDSFRLIGSDIIGKFNIKEFDVVHNNKTHNIIFLNENGSEFYNNTEINDFRSNINDFRSNINDFRSNINDFRSNINDFRSNINEYLLNKNMIVHCSITDENGDIVVDTTVEFRKFCYYYEKKFVLLPFFNHIQNYIRNKGNNDINIFDYNFTIYLNDSEFTEYKYCIRDILYSNFDMLFESNKFI